MISHRADRFLVVIGAMKCGTSSLFRYLAQHPAICPASDKEPGFFSVDYRWSKGIDYYQGLFNFEPARHRWALEASTDYTKRPHSLDVVSNMRSLGGAEFKFIYIMRNPLARIESHALHVARTQKEVGLFDLPKPYTSLDDGISNVSVDTSRYAYQLEPFVREFGKESVFLTTLEQLNEDPGGVLGDIFDFAGLDRVETDTGKHFNVGAAPATTPTFWAVAKRQEFLRRIWRSVLPGELRTQIWRRVAGKSGRFTLTAEERTRLLDELAVDLRELSSRYGIDVEGLWGITLESDSAVLRGDRA